MDLSTLASGASLVAGAISAGCWVVAATVKIAPPESLRGKPDGDYWDAIVLNGGDLIKTLAAQSRWNGAAAFAAAAAIALQIAAPHLA